MSLGLPADLAQFAGILSVIFLFVDGLLFGLALKKGMVSLILLVVALALAAYVGLSVPYLSTGDIVTHIANIAISLYNHLGPIFFAYPIFFILGLGIGIWKG